MNGLALFAGAGGLELGLGLAADHKVVCYVEREAYAAAILAARMEDGSLDEAPVWDDVTTFDGRFLRGIVEIVSGGFPCQDVSNAGKREGLVSEGDDKNRSGLWSEYARIVREVRPRFVFVENVSALVVRGLDRVLADLHALGFDAEWDLFRASDVGAPHRRERIFILAIDRDRPLEHAEVARLEGGGKGLSGPRRGEGRVVEESLPDADGGGIRILTERDEQRSAERGDAVAFDVGARVADADGIDEPQEHQGDERKPGERAARRRREFQPAGLGAGGGALRGSDASGAGAREGSPARHGRPGRQGLAGLVLNPQFVEALMGWPIGWTDCAPLATESFRSWQRVHSEFFSGGSCDEKRDEK